MTPWGVEIEEVPVEEATRRWIAEADLWPLIISSSDRSRTLPVGLHSFADQYMSYVHWQMAGALIAILPLIVAFFLFQRQFIQGIALTGMKQ